MHMANDKVLLKQPIFYLIYPSSSWDAVFFLNTLKYLHFSTEVVKDYVDFARLNCLHLHLFLEFKLKEIIGNLCSTLARENKHLVFADSHGKITARRRNFTTLLNLKDNKVQNVKRVIVHSYRCWACCRTRRYIGRQTDRPHGSNVCRQPSPYKSGYR